MVQAARSGSRNISEGSEASGTSKKTELKLTGVAWASLGELEKDYKAFLRTNGLKEWKEDDERRAELVARRCQTVAEFAQWVKEIRSRAKADGQRTSYAEVAANGALVLIGVARVLTNRLKHSQAKAFEKEGGFTERLYRVRSMARGQQDRNRQRP
jgi:four helix bundle suffix protein